MNINHYRGPRPLEMKTCERDRVAYLGEGKTNKGDNLKSIQKTPEPPKNYASKESIVALRAAVDAAGLTAKAAAAIVGVSAAKFEQKIRGYTPARSEEVGQWIGKIMKAGKIP